MQRLIGILILAALPRFFLIPASSLNALTPSQEPKSTYTIPEGTPLHIARKLEEIHLTALVLNNAEPGVLCVLLEGSSKKSDPYGEGLKFRYKSDGNQLKLSGKIKDGKTIEVLNQICSLYPLAWSVEKDSILLSHRPDNT